MSGSYGGSKTGGAGVGEDFYDWLATTAVQLYSEISPLRKDFIGTLEAALRGETEGGMIPIISRAVESAKQAASRTEQATTEELSRTGLSGTPFGASILGQARQQGEQAGSTAETNILQQLIAGIPSFALGQSQMSTLTGTGGESAGKGFQASGGMNV